MNNYDHVGRPTNEEVYKRNRKGKLKIIFAIVLLLILAGGIFIFANKDNIDFSSIMGNSSTTYNSIDLSNSSYYDYIFNYSNSTSNALQGSAYYNKNIYFSMASTSSNKNKKTKIFTYNLGSKKVTELSDLYDYYQKENMQSYKINDIVNADGRNYYAAYSTNNQKPISHVMFNMNKVIRRADYNNGLEQLYFIGLGYNSNNKKFYSLYGVGNDLRVYVHSISADYNGTTASITDGTYYILDSTIPVSSITSQGITIRGSFLYCANQDKDSGINYINVYDLRTGKEKNRGEPIKLVRRIKLGKTNSKYELESIFFVGNNLYLGYNSSSFRAINFYKISLDNSKVTANLTSTTQNNGSVLLTGKVVNNSQFGFYTYCFCNNPKGENCSWTFVRDSSKKLIVPNKLTITKTITQKGTSKWYFLARDIIGNNKVSNYVTVDIK